MTYLKHNAVGRRKLRVLKRRADFIESRLKLLKERGKYHSFDGAELSALWWALEMLVSDPESIPNQEGGADAAKHQTALDA